LLAGDRVGLGRPSVLHGKCRLRGMTAITRGGIA
jgi:hypothetical protein